MADHNGWRKHRKTRRTGHSQFPKGLKPILSKRLLLEAADKKTTKKAVFA